MQNETGKSSNSQITAPTVTVIISTYNSPDYLRQSLQSVREQTFTDYEIIVVDDCSPEDVVSQYDLPDDVRLIRLDRNHGRAAHGRNIGICEAKGRYITFLDADDVWLPDKLESQVKLLDAHPDAGLTYCQMTVTDVDLVPLGKQPEMQPVSNDPLRQIILNNFIGSPSFVMVPRDVLLETGGFDEELISASDRDLWTRILRKRYPIFDPVPHVLYRTHQGQMSNDRVTIFNARTQILIKSFEYVKNHRRDLIYVTRRRLCKNYWHLGKCCLARGDDASEVLDILMQGYRVKPWNIRLNLLIVQVYIRTLLHTKKK